MEISEVGLDLIKSNEGCKLRAYLDPVGIPTIGYGHTGPEVKLNMVITQEEADAYLQADVAVFTKGVLEACLPTVPTQSELDALVCFSYNVGLANLKTSTVLKQFKAGNKMEAARAFLLWDKATDRKTGKKVILPGLVKRRTEEQQLFLADDTQGTVERAVTPLKTTVVPETSVVPTPPPNPSLSKEVIGGLVVGVSSVGQILGSVSADDAAQMKQGTIQLQSDAMGSTFFKHIHMPEIAAGMTVVLSMWIVWKKFADRNKGVS